jgi:thymidylate synthase (FAD)
MKLIKPSVEIIPQKPGLLGIYEQIELAARNCYKSEDAIKYDEEGNSLTAKDFVDKIVNVYKHRSVAEQGTIYLKVPMNIVTNALAESEWDILSHNHWTKYTCDSNFYYYTANYRVILENELLDVLKYLCEPTEYHEKRVTVRFICSRGVSHELVRHRAMSFSQESTRYCNYSKGKFNNELTFIKPEWLIKLNSDGYSEKNRDSIRNFLYTLETIELSYMYLLEKDLKSQDAREVLPNALKTEVVVTGFVSDWKHFFELRTAGNAHPDIRALALNLQEQFKQMMFISK